MTDAYLQIPWTRLVPALLLLTANLGISAAMKLGLARDLAIAAARMTVQLLLVGLVLEWVFRQEHPALVLGLALAMSTIASVAAVRRTRRRFPGIFWDSLVSILGASLVVTGITLAVVVRPTPWYDPQYVIPLHGMLLGNALTGISLALDRFMEGCTERRDRIEMLLSLGATRWEAALPEIRDALRTGTIPLINTMSIMGVVSLPGMMTGQILAGAAPTDAVRYQLMIMTMIASCVALATLGVVWLAWRRLFDADHRLRRERLRAA